MVAGRETVELTVDRLVAGGAGLAALDGRKVFVPLAAPGERVRARLVLTRRDYAVAKLVEVIEPSPLRREPRCPYFGRCGGCQLQHITYEEQLRVKQEFVADALRRIARLDIPASAVLRSPEEWRYRNKTQYAVGFHRGPRVGFFAAGSHRIVPVRSCVLHPELFDAARRACADWLERAAGQAYRERTHTGNLRHLVLRTDGTRTVALVVTRTRRLGAGLVDRLLGVPGIDAVARNFNPEPTNRILGAESRPVQDKPLSSRLLPALEYELAGNRLRVSPAAFFQVNTAQAGTVASLVRDRLADRHWPHVVDLYCGVGALALAVAGLADRVTGVELEPAAVADARHNAEFNRTDNVRFLESDATGLPAGVGPADAVILDPPRKGASRELIAALAAARPARIVYVSCDPATLARDLALLAEAGYPARDVQPVDMFPQTAHVETVVTLDRADG